jgi:hypothetical protein
MEVGDPEEQPDIVIMPREDPIPRELPARESPVQVPEVEPVEPAR